MTKVDEIKQKRAELIAKQRELIDKSWKDNRQGNLNSDEETTYQKIQEDLTLVESNLKRELELFNRELSVQNRVPASSVPPPSEPVLPAKVRERIEESEQRVHPIIRAHTMATQIAIENRVMGGTNKRLTPEQSQLVERLDDAGERFLRYGASAVTPEEKRDLSVGNATAGGTLVPTSMAAQILIYERDFGVMRQVSNVFQTATGDTFNLPRVTAFGSSGWVAEGNAFTESDPTIGSVAFSAYKGTHIAQVSEELLQDSSFDVMALLSRIFGQNLGVLQNTAFVSGNGTGRPTGIANNVTTGKTLASNVAITADELVDSFHSVLPPYRPNAVWLLNDATIASIRKLVTGVSGDKTYIWQPGLAAGQPDTLLGRPVYADPDVATMANSAKCGYFGDFKAGYWIRDVGSLYVQRLIELYAGTGQVGFRVWQRCDGKQVDALAVKAIVNNAS